MENFTFYGDVYDSLEAQERCQFMQHCVTIKGKSTNKQWKYKVEKFHLAGGGFAEVAQNFTVFRQFHRDGYFQVLMFLLIKDS